jgi:hypothetical protein
MMLIQSCFGAKESEITKKINNIIGVEVYKQHLYACYGLLGI